MLEEAKNIGSQFFSLASLAKFIISLPM